MRAHVICLLFAATTIGACSEHAADNIVGNAASAEAKALFDTPAPDDASRYENLTKGYREARARVRNDPVGSIDVDAPRKALILETELRRLAPAGFDKIRQQEDFKDAEAVSKQNRASADEVMNEINRQ